MKDFNTKEIALFIMLGLLIITQTLLVGMRYYQITEIELPAKNGHVHSHQAEVAPDTTEQVAGDLDVPYVEPDTLFAD